MSTNTVLFEEVASKDFLGFQFGTRGYSHQLTSAIAKTGKVCAVECSVRDVASSSGDGRTVQVVWLTHNFKFLGGSLGCAEGEVLARGFEHAREHKLAVVIECRSGGARMQEGTLSLMQLAKVSVCVEAHRRAGLPFISALTDPTYGGVPASYAMQSDVRIGVSGARIGFAGPAVILNTMYEMDQSKFDDECPSDFQSAEYLQAHGQLDMVVESDDKLESAVADVVLILQGKKAGAAAAAAASKSVVVEEQKSSSSSSSSSSSGGTASMDYTSSRSMARPQCQDMIDSIFTEFVELKGDGRVSGDGCIRGGLGSFGGGGENGEENDSTRCVVIASFKGHTPGDMQAANYGMSSPAGYRKALRLMRLAERFELPVVTLVDTCGALPSFDAERDGQSEAIATNLTTMASLKVPIITVIAGEGGSGGALGIAMGNVVGMLSTAYYGVISPEGAASILGRYKNDEDKAARFSDDCRALATMQKIYAPQLQELGVVDEVLWDQDNEGHAHFPALASKITEFIQTSLKKLATTTTENLIQQRYEKFRKMGKFDSLDSKQREERVELARTVPQPVRPDRRAGDKVANAPSRILQYLSDRTISGQYSSLKGRAPEIALSSYVPALATTPVRTDPLPTRENAKSVLDRDGPEALATWIRANSPTKTFITDTTLRDAHQSLLATRMRTIDLLAGCPEASHVLHDAFSFECWGGATFDVSYRFLSEDPWVRLREIRQAVPNVCLQMLIRGANAVGEKIIIDFNFFFYNFIVTLFVETQMFVLILFSLFFFFPSFLLFFFLSPLLFLF